MVSDLRTPLYIQVNDMKPHKRVFTILTCWRHWCCFVTAYKPWMSQSPSHMCSSLHSTAISPVTMAAITITSAQASIHVIIHGGSVIDVVYAHLQQNSHKHMSYSLHVFRFTLHSIKHLFCTSVCVNSVTFEMTNSKNVLGSITALRKCCLSEAALHLHGELIEPSE